MAAAKSILRNRILLAILIPVCAIGILLSFLLTSLLIPPLVSVLKSRTNTIVKNASDMGLAICEERLADLLDLRLENDREMNAVSRQEAIDQIKAVRERFPGIHMLILHKDRGVVGATLDIPLERLHLPKLKRLETEIISQDFWGEPIKIHYRYFPYWQWYIVSLISEKDYKAPILMAKRIVGIGTFGVLIVVLMSLFLLFVWRVNRPLKQIITATEEVSRGHFSHVQVRRQDEIAQVARAFNSMVDSLQDDQRRIRSILVELRESEEQYRLLTEHSLAGITMIQDGTIIYANEKAIEMSGYSAEEFIGIKAWDMVHPEDRQEIEGKILAFVQGELEADHFEFRSRTKTAETRWIEMLAVLIVFKGTNTILTHAIDVTERKTAQFEQERLEAKLLQAQKMEAVGTLAGGVAHDLNNILTGLVSYPELLLLDIPEDSPLRKPMLTIQESGKKAAAIVQDLLTLARRGVAITEVVNLNDVISDYLKTPEYEKIRRFHADVEFEIELAPDLLHILGSPIHLSKTFMNIISNAAEAMSAGGKVFISTRNQYVDRTIGGRENLGEGDYVVLSVVDSGVGISKEDLTRIFEPFYTKKAMGRSGTGLGMAVVWGTVKDHNGYIDLQSIAGKGTRFDIYFPVTRREPTEKGATVSIKEYMGNESILLVDDIEEQREIASQILSKLGYSVTTAASGEEAIEYMKSKSADLLVLDMIMEPGLDGLDTYKGILELHPRQKAIIVSGFSETERVKEAQGLGVGSYIKKPYVLEKIGLAIRRELDK